MEGTKLTKKQKDSKLYDEFDRFTSEKGEMIQSYYLRFAKLLNDMNITGISMTPLQINTKFVKYLQHEWSRFNENDANEVRIMRQRFPDPLALISNTYNPPPSYSIQQSLYTQQTSELSQHQPIIPPLQQHNYEPPVVEQQSPALSTQLDSGLVITSFLPPDDPIASLNKAMMFLSTTFNSRFPPTNNQLRTSSNPRTQETIQDDRGTVQNVQGRQSQGYGVDTGKGKATETRAIHTQEDEVILQEEQQDFMADGLEEFDSDCNDLQLNTTSIIKANHVDAFDSDCDEAPTVVQSSWQYFLLQYQ
ncbi:hypothetical protein Tco_0684975 [Tanacetum coccineum]